jgi:hypothetical protein
MLAVLVHFICASLPCATYIITRVLLVTGWMTNDTAEAVVTSMTICFVTETVINVLVYINRLPGLKGIVWRTKGEGSSDGMSK